MATPMHHTSVRKRIYQNLEEFPSKDPFKRFLDRLIFVVGFLGPLFTIPQLVNVWIAKQVAGVSFASWAAYAALDIVWIVYGFVHKEKPIVFAYMLWFIANAGVAIGVLVVR
jgi:MtN3 and saliva related transmembrane protein